MKYAFDLNGDDFFIWEKLFKKIVLFNEKTRKYIDDEIRSLDNFENKIGVLIRGTDYVALKPRFHPRQSTIKEVIEKVDEFISKYGYGKIYVVTEEQKLLNIVIEHFGKDIVEINNRQFYDSYWSSKNQAAISEIHFDRENDNYLKGLEYLSSLTILSNCSAIVAGNCGGTFYSLVMKNNFKHICVFNKGLY